MVRKPSADRGPRPFLVHRLPGAAEPDLFLDLRRHPGGHARLADRDRRVPGHVLHAECRDGLPVRRAHHARRELRLAAPLPARQRRVDVLRRRLHPHLPELLLRLLQGAARGSLHPRRDHLPSDDGHRLHGLRASLGPDELLGRHRDHEPVLGDPARRRHHRQLPLGRLFGGQPDAQPLLLAALPAALHDRGRRRPAHLGAPRAGPEQPDRHSDQVGQGRGSVHALCDDQGHLRRRRVHDLLRLLGVLHAELSRPCGQLHPGEPGRDALAHRARMVLPAVLRDPARHSRQARRRHRHGRGHRDLVLHALARHLEGALHGLSPALQAVLLGLRGRLRPARLARLAARPRAGT